jgi:hypothetical protein
MDVLAGSATPEDIEGRLLHHARLATGTSD